MNNDPVADAASIAEPKVRPYEPFPTFQSWLETPFDGTSVDRFLRQLSALKESVTPKQLSEAIRIATNWAAVNTGAIEGLYQVDRGFTYSVAVSSVAWQKIEAIKGDSAAQHIADAVKAYDFVLDAATGSHPLTEVWVRELHEIVTSSQDKYTVITAVGPQEHDLPKGRYKSHPNSPLNFDSNTVHGYASPSETPAEMARFLEELRSESFAAEHPIVQASYAHYAFVCIHPFADGNGRVARALSAMFLYRAYGIPLVVFADQKADYIAGLEQADQGRTSQFVRFIGERVIDTIGMLREQVLAAAVPDVSEQIGELMPLLSGQAGLPHEEIDAITLRLLTVFSEALAKQVTDQHFSVPLVGRVHRHSRGVTTRAPRGYRRVPGDTSGAELRVTIGGPADVAVSRQYYCVTRLPDNDDADFIVYRASGEPMLEMYLREAHPTISQALVFRAETAALRELRELVAEVREKAAASLRKAGYLS
ncbi:Fic family protein [Microbacterium marinilacus]|uniref:Fido domain-containing protein n=1 Tax=Microbacterium marinilacus TaxID=415209 RepID=A0ABP7B6D8_9MICO|nr:Fic family protein [Microbacterium marinilacus]MBY0687773.1 Fic family protein [Microbacterium marinilacus]